MTAKELIQQLSQLFGKNRQPLRKAILAVQYHQQVYQKIGRKLRRRTGQAVRFCPSEVFDELEHPDEIMFPMADASVYYQLVLNPGCRNGLDFDVKLATRCKGTVYLCDIWISILFPFFAMDTYSMTYNPEIREYEFVPYVPKQTREKKILKTVQVIMHDHSFSLISRQVAKRRVPLAITYCRDKNKATIFDCLFSDIQSYRERPRSLK